MTGTCEVLARLAAAHEGEAEGLELDETWTASREVAATPEGLDGTTYELAQRYVRTAGPRVGYARSEDAGETLEGLVAEALRRAGTVERSVPPGALVAPAPGEAPEEAPEALPAPDVAAMADSARAGLDALLARAGEARAARCTVRAFDERRLVSNSLGLSRAASHRHYLARMDYIAVGERELHDVTVRSYAARLEDLDLGELAARAVAQGEASLDGGSVESGRYPVVVSREVACRMLVGMWAAFSADKMATGQSLMAGRLGMRVASEELTLLVPGEDGLPGAPGRVGLDSEGVRRTGHVVVDRGVLRAPLSDVSWARQLGLEPSGNAGRREGLGRIVPNDVVVAPANLCLAPGERTLEELLAQMGDGIYLTEIGDIYHSFNLASGGVSAPVRGVRVRDGRLAEPIAAMSVTDTLPALLEGVVAAGNTLSWSDLEDLDALWCGAPDLYLRELGIVGGLAS